MFLNLVKTLYSKIISLNNFEKQNHLFIQLKMFSTWISTQAESALYSEMKAPLTILHKKLKLRIALNYRSFPRGSDLPH